MSCPELCSVRYVLLGSNLSWCYCICNCCGYYHYFYAQFLICHATCFCLFWTIGIYLFVCPQPPPHPPTPHWFPALWCKVLRTSSQVNAPPHSLSSWRELSAVNSSKANMCLLNGRMHKSWDWSCELLGGISLAFPLKYIVTSTVVDPRCISPMAKETVWNLNWPWLALTISTSQTVSLFGTGLGNHLRS